MPERDDMTLERACEVLTRHRHDGFRWFAAGDKAHGEKRRRGDIGYMTHLASFEAIAVAEKYERGSVATPATPAAPSRDDPATAPPLGAAIAEYMRAFGLAVDRVEIVEDFGDRWAKVVVDGRSLAMIPFRDPAPAAPPRGAAEGDAELALAAIRHVVHRKDVEHVNIDGVLANGKVVSSCGLPAEPLRALLAAAETPPPSSEAADAR